MDNEVIQVIVNCWLKFTGRPFPQFHDKGCVVCGSLEKCREWSGYYDISIAIIQKPVCLNCRKTLKKLQVIFLTQAAPFVGQLIHDISMHFLTNHLISLKVQKDNIDKIYAEQLRSLVDVGAIVVKEGILQPKIKNETKN